jgi:hypothetical protein
VGVVDKQTEFEFLFGRLPFGGDYSDVVVKGTADAIMGLKFLVNYKTIHCPEHTLSGAQEIPQESLQSLIWRSRMSQVFRD